MKLGGGEDHARGRLLPLRLCLLQPDHLGPDQYTEVRIRHTKGAPDRWLDEVTPVLREYSQASAKPVVFQLEKAGHSGNIARWPKSSPKEWRQSNAFTL